MQNKTSKALGVSYTSVHRIMNGNRPCKSNRPKERAEFFDDFDYCVIIFITVYVVAMSRSI
jgi:hypothetical protein